MRPWLQAAGAIHTDFERGFICAEVMHYDELKELGSEAAVKAAGKYRQEGEAPQDYHSLWALHSRHCDQSCVCLAGVPEQAVRMPVTELHDCSLPEGAWGLLACSST